MFQTFDVPSTPEQGPARLKSLRQEMVRAGVDGFLVPRADAHQGEYVAPCDARLAWLTGFTGSAGFCAVLADIAGVFVDGRYRTQIKTQVDLAHFTPVDWPETKLADWTSTHLPHEATLGFDPWLHTLDEVTALEAADIKLRRCENLVDNVWPERPAKPSGKVIAYPIEFSGESSCDKRARIAQSLQDNGALATVLTLPDSICWLLNIRGSDIERNPVVQAFVILHDTGKVQLFSDPAKFSDLPPDHDIELLNWDAFAPALRALKGAVQIDASSTPIAISDILEAAGADITTAQDPCMMPKARKNPVEIAGSRAAHLRDGVAMVQFLAWLDETAPKGGLFEIDVVQKLEGFRRATNMLKDISFETICGSGPNGAIIHYRVSKDTNRAISNGELLLVDSGGQYLDGTTDITRTLAIGDVGITEKQCFTRVLQGMIAISQARFPKGLAGRDLDPLARAPLWLAGQDYDHGTGHGVGAYLSVHEGPQRISRVSDVPFEAGMMLSNEPGYYREGAFGIRIENLIVVRDAPALTGADAREMFSFETLTYVPIDRRLIVTEALSVSERVWLNDYHAKTLELLMPHLTEPLQNWLTAACAPL